MNLVYLRSNVIYGNVANVTKIIQYNNFIPINVELDRATGNSIVTFDYESKCIYTSKKCIDRYLQCNKYVNQYFNTCIHGNHTTKDYIDHIYIQDVDAKEAMLSNNYRLYTDLTRSFYMDRYEIDTTPLKITFKPQPYQNGDLYERISKWING